MTLLLAKRWERALPRDTPQSVLPDPLGRPVLWATLKSGGLGVFRVEDGAEIARVPTRALGGLDAMHLCAMGDGSPLCLALGDFFAARGAKAGLATIAIDSPEAPRVLGQWISPERKSGAAALTVEGTRAYLAAMRHGVLVFDLSDPRSPRLRHTVALDPDFPTPSPSRTRHPNARGLALRGEFLFVANDAGGVRALALAGDASLREIGRYANAGMGRKQQAYNSLLVDGDRLYAAVDYAGLEILDIARPDAIQPVGWWNPWRAQTAGNLWFNSPGHTNQLALDRERRRVYLSAGESELVAVDVGAPERPALAAAYGSPRDGRGTWGLALDRETIYLTYLRTAVPFRGTWSGIVAVTSRSG